MKLLNKKLKNKKGATIVLLTILMMSGVLLSTISIASIVQNNIISGRNQSYSTLALDAAETGTEKVLYEMRKNGFDVVASCSDGQYINIGNPTTCQNSRTDVNLSNGSYYYIYYSEDPGNGGNGYYSTTTIFGVYKDTHRSLAISFCKPDCSDSNICNDNGCGETCPSDCLALPGCRDDSTGVSNVHEDAARTCCTSGQECYVCDSGYHWDGGDCVEN